MSSLFWYRPVFVVQLLIAESFFAKKFAPRKHFLLRLIIGVLVCLGIAFAIPYKIENWAYLSFIFVFMFATTVVLGVVCFEESFKTILFCAIAGYTVQHIASEFCNVFDSIMSAVTDWRFDLYEIYSTNTEQQNTAYILVAYLIIYVWTYVISYKSVVPKVEKTRVLQTENKVIMWLFALIVLVDVLISAVVQRVYPMSTLSLLGRVPSMVVKLILHGYNILCCVLAIVLIIELPRRSGAENELAIVKKLYHDKREQYETTKENIELINMKCHDLKYSLTKTGDDEREIKEIVDIYDSAYKTENEALNVVLMEKSLICKHENINLSVIADSSKLGFMKDADVYVLFGNILDNAIEAVRKVEAENGRSIGLNIKTVNSFLIVNAFNQYTGEIAMDGGLPKTTKKETDYHGFGLKSIKYIVQKYNGEMAIDVKGLFSLTISFQL